MSANTMIYIAKQAASSHLSGAGPLNDLLTDASRRHHLNPDQVQRVVELANHEVHAAFYKAASDGQAEDRHVEFDIARSDEILDRLAGGQEKTASSRPGDYLVAPDRGWRESARPELEKTASAEPAEDPVRQEIAARSQQSELLKQASLSKTAHEISAGHKLNADFAYAALVKEASSAVRARRATFDQWRGALLSARPTTEAARLTAKIASDLCSKGLLDESILVKVASDCDPALFDLDLPEGYQVNPEWCVLKMVDTLINSVRAGEGGYATSNDAAEPGRHPWKKIRTRVVNE